MKYQVTNEEGLAFTLQLDVVRHDGDGHSVEVSNDLFNASQGIPEMTREEFIDFLREMRQGMEEGENTPTNRDDIEAWYEEGNGDGINWRLKDGSSYWTWRLDTAGDDYDFEMMEEEEREEVWANFQEDIKHFIDEIEDEVEDIDEIPWKTLTMEARQAIPQKLYDVLDEITYGKIRAYGEWVEGILLDGIHFWSPVYEGELSDILEYADLENDWREMANEFVEELTEEV